MRFLLLLCFLPAFNTLRCQSVEFYREDLVFSIDSVYFTVNGTYYFRNQSDKPVSIPIAYPVPRVGFQEAIDTLVVYDIENEIPLHLLHRDSLYLFQLEIAAGNQKSYTISYRQKHNGSSAKYILTTTSFWGKPIEEASYDLVIPGYLHADEFSYDPDTSSGFRDDTIYHWKKKNFMPDRDFKIHFHKK